MNKAYQLANAAKPTVRQLKWQQTEFYGLISYGMPVFTGKQYGDGFIPPAVFWPEDMDTDGWCETAQNAGMRGLILTCKHYDGFCLWPTAFTQYSVKNSNWLDGAGDLVRLLSDSCKKFGLKFGVYLAPWDRHEKSYGSGKEYDDFFCGLLTELLSNYGDIFCVWLDGICGSDETREQKYDWARYYRIIRELQPEAAIAFRGPDVRWCSNERGNVREAEWSPVPAGLGVQDDGSTVPSVNKKIHLLSPDIGSRKAIKHEEKFIWYPCEVSLPLRKHWFFNEDDKYATKTKDKLLKLYYETVGNNSCLMLGLSPNKRGEIDEIDTQILTAFGKDLAVMFGGNIVNETAHIKASTVSGNHIPEHIKNDEMTLFWQPDPSEKAPYITVTFEKEEPFDKIVLSENISNGQHIEEFTVYYLNEKGKFKPVYQGTTVGYKRICSIKPIKCKTLKIEFTKFRDFFELSGLQIN